jgi:alpha-beta hydrolase superfamily lysophospholipase
MIALAPIYEVPDWRIRLLRFIRPALPWLYPHKMGSLKALVRERILDFDPAFDFDGPDAEAMVRRMSRLPTAALEEMRRTVAWGQRMYPQLTTPILILDGDHDIAVSPESGRRLFEAVGSEDKRHVCVKGAGHELMRPSDPAHERIWGLVSEFVLERSELLTEREEGG